MERNKYVSLEWLYQFHIGLLAFVIVVFPKFTAMAFLGFVPIIAYGLITKAMRFKLTLVPILFIGLYLLYVAYCSITDHPDIAGRYLEYKLSLILLPFLLAFKPKKPVNWSITILMFLIGMLILTVQGLYASFNCFGQTGNTVCFFTTSFSYKHHPTYSSIYALLAICLAIYGRVMNFKGFNWKWIAPFLFLMVMVTFFNLSLAGILFFFIFVSAVILYLISKRFGRKVAILTAVVLPAAFAILVAVVPRLEGEWNGSTKEVANYIHDPVEFSKSREYPFSGTVARFVMWTASYQILTEHPFGVGTGNVDEKLIAQVQKLEQPELAELNYNPHNQYLQTGIEIGLLGILTLLLIVYFTVRKGVKMRNWILVIFGLNFAFNMLFESILQRQEGLVFFVLVLCLLYDFIPKKKESVNLQEEKV